MPLADPADLIDPPDEAPPAEAPPAGSSPQLWNHCRPPGMPPMVPPEAKALLTLPAIAPPIADRTEIMRPTAEAPIAPPIAVDRAEIPRPTAKAPLRLIVPFDQACFDAAEDGASDDDPELFFRGDEGIPPAAPPPKAAPLLIQNALRYKKIAAARENALQQQRLRQHTMPKSQLKALEQQPHPAVAAMSSCSSSSNEQQPHQPKHAAAAAAAMSSCSSSSSNTSLHEELRQERMRQSGAWGNLLALARAAPNFPKWLDGANQEMARRREADANKRRRKD